MAIIATQIFISLTYPLVVNMGQTINYTYRVEAL